MASKKYAYYNKGNKIAIVQEESTGSGGNLAVAHCTLGGYTTKDTCEAAGGQWIPSSSSSFSGNRKYKSPTESVADGLEIEYTYAPIYHVSSDTTVDVNKFYINGWTIIGGYLTFLRHRFNTAEVSWTDSPESAVTSGSAGGGSNDYIVVGGSSRWNGLHKVQTAGTEGQLVTYTKVNQTVPYFEDQDIDFSNDETIYDGASNTIHLADHFGTDDYIWLSGNDGSVANNGLFSISSITQSVTGASSKLTLGTKYGVLWSTASATTSTGIEIEYSAAASLGPTSADTTINIYKAYRDFSYILTDVDVLNDENDEIDLTSYQSKAIVYYLKAKMAEDGGDFKQREYFIREFKRQLEKERSARKRGPYIAMGNANMRTL